MQENQPKLWLFAKSRRVQSVMLLRALRPDVGGWVTLSSRYWAGRPSDTDGGWAPYSAVLNCDPSWSSKLARCLTQQCKRICAKAETMSPAPGNRSGTAVGPG